MLTCAEDVDTDLLLSQQAVDGPVVISVTTYQRTVEVVMSNVDDQRVKQLTKYCEWLELKLIQVFGLVLGAAAVGVFTLQWIDADSVGIRPLILTYTFINLLWILVIFTRLIMKRRHI